LAPLLVLFFSVPQDWDYALPRPNPRFRHTVPFRAAALSPDGTILIGLDADGAIRGWDTRTARLLYGRPVLAKDDVPQVLTCSPDGRFVALSSRHYVFSTARVLNLSTGEEVRRFDRCFSPVFSPDGEILAGTDGTKLRRWAIKSGAELPQLDPAAADLKWVAYSPQGGHGAASHADSGSVSVWDLGTRRRTIHAAGDSPATALAFSPDGKTLAVGAHWGVKYMLLSGEWNPAFESHEEYASGPIHFSRDGKRMIAVSQRRRLLVWELAGGRPLFTWSAFNISEGLLDVSPGGDRVLWFDRDGLRLERIPELLGGRDAGHVVTTSLFTIDGKAVTADDEGRVRVWDPATQKELRGYQVPGRNVKFFARQGRWVLYGEGPNAVQIWDLEAGKELAGIPVTPQLTAVEISPDAATVALGHADGSISLWDVAGKKERARIRLELAGVAAIAWSRDGKKLAWGDQVGTVVIAEGSAGRDPACFKPRADAAIGELAFREDGKTLVVRNKKGIAWTYKDDVGVDPVQVALDEPFDPGIDQPDRRWVASGFHQPNRSLHYNSWGFSPDGRYIVTTTTCGRALIWEAPGEK
jgi:WD40 repeat protein